MKWNKPKKETPNRRFKTRFAWLPVRTTLPNNETVIWLERYQTNEKLYRSYYEDFWHIEQIAPLGYWDKDGEVK